MIAFDEVQLIHKIHFDEIFAAIYDNYKQIKLILTGSEIGLLDAFLGKRNADSSLFGRPSIEVETKKLAAEQISEFLVKGFMQINKVNNLTEIKEVIENLDGIIGWAAHYGWLRSKNNAHQTAMAKIIEEGTALAKKEFDNFLIKRKKINYMRVLQWISKGHNRWALLKAQFLKSNLKTSDRQLQLYLKKLLDYSFIEKANDIYIISDPLLARAVL